MRCQELLARSKRESAPFISNSIYEFTKVQNYEWIWPRDSQKSDEFLNIRMFEICWDLPLKCASFFRSRCTIRRYFWWMCRWSCKIPEQFGELPQQSSTLHGQEIALSFDVGWAMRVVEWYRLEPRYLDCSLFFTWKRERMMLNKTTWNLTFIHSSYHSYDCWPCFRKKEKKKKSTQKIFKFPNICILPFARVQIYFSVFDFFHCTRAWCTFNTDCFVWIGFRCCRFKRFVWPNRVEKFGELCG